MGPSLSQGLWCGRQGHSSLAVARVFVVGAQMGALRGSSPSLGTTPSRRPCEWGNGVQRGDFFRKNIGKVLLGIKWFLRQWHSSGPQG
jgi:hypothetical protein